MDRFRLLAGLTLLIASVGCGDGGSVADSTLDPGLEGSTITAPVAGVPTTSVVDATSTAGSDAGAVIPADFPVPIHDGGTVIEASALDAIVVYPESEHEPLVDHYEAISGANGGTHFDLFPEGDSWEVQGILIEVYPVDPQTDPYPPGIVLDIALP